MTVPRPELSCDDWRRICDALRYLGRDLHHRSFAVTDERRALLWQEMDQCLELADRLAGAGLGAALETGLAALPTITQTSKPALVPIDQTLLGPGSGLDARRAPDGPAAGVQVLRGLMANAQVQVLLGTDDVGDPSGVAWTEAPRLVRGLDYYTRTTFEFSHAGLGAQSGIGGGGRYDGLMASLGGQALSGIGYGIGTDRTFLACRAEGITPDSRGRCEVYLVPLGEPARQFCSQLGGRLRAVGVRNDMAFGDRALKGAMKGADRSGARYAVIVGEQELDAGVAVVKDLSSGAQRSVPAAGLVDELRSMTEQEEMRS